MCRYAQPIRHWRSLCCLALAVAGPAALYGCASRNANGKTDAELEKQIQAELQRDEPHQPNAAASDRAALPASGPISLADLLAMAEAHNPALAAARSEFGIASGQAWQASLYPNPRLELAAEEIPFESGGGIDEGITTVSVIQPIVIGGRLRAAVDAAEAEKAASRARVQMSMQQIFGEVAQLHARLLAIRQAQALYDELAELGGQTLGMARTRFQAGAAPETEVIRPQIEMHQIELARARLSNEERATMKQLELLLGGIEIDGERLSGELPENPPATDLDALTASVRQSHPALLVADRDIEAAEARLEQVKEERVPDLDLRVGGGYKGETDDGIVEVGAGMTLPLWNNRQGDILSARFALMRARQQRSVIETDLLQRLTRAHGEFESARAQLATMRDQIVPAANRSYAQTQEAYRGGRATFLDLLDAQRTLVEARTTLIELSGAAAAGRAQIMQVVGGPQFQFNGIGDPQLDPLPSSGSSEGGTTTFTTTLQPREGAEGNP